MCAAAVKEKLGQIYYDASHPASYGGIRALVKASDLPRKQVKDWLATQWSYTLHKPVRRKFPHRKYIVRHMDFQWQADLVEMQPFAKSNRGYRYLMTVIDLLSRHAWAVPLKTKSAIDVKAAFKLLFDKMTNGRVPKFIQTDEGLEFENRLVRGFLRNKYGIEQFSVKSAHKAAVVERFNRTLKTRMWRAFTKQGNHKWLDLLPKLLYAYNHSYHRTLGRAPADVTRENEADVWLDQYGGKKSKPKKQKFSLGDRVRISRHKATFEKGYEPNWSEEEYIIHSVNLKYSPITYKIRTLDGSELIEGSFYEQELQLVKETDGYYRIDEVIRTHGRGANKKALVRWRGYKQPEWIDYATIQHIKNVPH